MRLCWERTVTQLFLARFREFIRQPEAVFWSYVFPLVMIWLHDIQPAIAFAAAEEFSRANADKILIGHAAVATFTEVIFNSCQCTGTVCNSQATIGR